MNWVEALFDCSLDHAWLALRERVQSDVAAWHTRAGEGAKVNITVETGRLLLSASSEFGDAPWASVERKERLLHVRTGPSLRDGGSVNTFQLVPTVNSKGECRLLRESDELEFWQASRLILQPLLFR